MPKVTLDISSALPLEEPQLPSENFRRSDKWKRVINDEGEKTMPKRGMEDEDSVGDSRMAKRGREISLRRARENTTHSLGATQTSITPIPARTNASISDLVRMN
ncbi:hypothetical protein Fot_37903 [Forsythia ovata]|uniref:Uncharacterized protein n=1 Tax=Forsythia ovata TaxID=205694 RepID=A0ABD1S129_9LAMI